jgi:hypothetical protein
LGTFRGPGSSDKGFEKTRLEEYSTTKKSSKRFSSGVCVIAIIFLKPRFLLLLYFGLAYQSRVMTGNAYHTKREEKEIVMEAA